MTRAYLRLDPRFDDKKHQYPDGAYAALIATFCLAESQPDRGRFRSPRYLAGLLEKRGRWVSFLLDKHDLMTLPDGRIYVDGWDEWQEGDWKVAERVERIRQRPRNAAVSADVTVPVTVDVTPDATASRLSVSGRHIAVGEAVSAGAAMPARRNGPEPLANILPRVDPIEDAFGVSEEEGRVFAFIARFGAAIRPDSGYGRRLLGLMERRGVEEVLKRAGEMAKSGEKLSDRQWVFGLEAALEQVPSSKDAREQDAAEAARKRNERVQADMERRRKERERWMETA